MIYPDVYVSIYIYIHIYIYLGFHMCIHIYIYISVYIYIFMDVSIYLSNLYLSNLYLYIYLALSLSLYMFVEGLAAGPHQESSVQSHRVAASRCSVASRGGRASNPFTTGHGRTHHRGTPNAWHLACLDL